jgi:TolB-like protein
MSPEQLEGREIDVRSDIFSLGAILYELATGERPFKGDTSISLISSIVKDSPDPVDALRAGLPHHLGRVVGRCLEKNAERRYQTAKDVRNELEALSKEIESDMLTRSSRAAIPAPAGRRSLKPWPLAAGISITVIALGLLWFAGQERPYGEVSQPAAGDPVLVDDSEEPMIAVLPFENLGPPEEEYFADGMTEEITSRLAMVGGLGVISRTSSMQYKENRPPLKQIGDELGVDYVLEGTVRWAKSPEGPGRVRITPQLIRVIDDRHLWADNIERELEDIFAVQAEIAEQVISQLGVTLLASEKTAIEDRPTESIPAYEAYLRGLEAFDSFEHKEAARLFELAVEEDPGFVKTQAQLVVTYARLHAWGDYSEDWSVLSAAALETVQALAPEDLDVQLATAVYDYYIREDFSGALAIVDQLAEKHANNTELLKYSGYLSRRLGRWEDSNSGFERALRLDPRDPSTLLSLGRNLQDLQRYEEAEALYDQCIAVAPDRSNCFRAKAWNRLYWTGDTAAARRIAEEGPEHFWNDFLLAQQDYLDRDYGAASERLEKLGQSETGEWFGQRIRVSIPYAFGDVERAQEAARELMPTFEQLIKEQPKDFIDMSVLAMLYAVLGNKELALATGERAGEIGQHDLYQLPFTWFMMAETCLIVGEHQRAIDLVDQVLATPGWDRPSHHWYRLDPLWDPLRGDPRFQALLDEHAQARG